MNRQSVMTVIGLMPKEFDSHDFILKFLEIFPAEYGELLIHHKTVNDAHAEIGRFLLDKDNKLEIEKAGEHDSPNIFRNLSPCALWQKK